MLFVNYLQCKGDNVKWLVLFYTNLIQSWKFINSSISKTTLPNLPKVNILASRSWYPDMSTQITLELWPLLIQNVGAVFLGGKFYNVFFLICNVFVFLLQSVAYLQILVICLLSSPTHKHQQLVSVCSFHPHRWEHSLVLYLYEWCYIWSVGNEDPGGPVDRK